MPKPTTVISFAYGLDIDGNPTWQDITSFVKSFNISRGKSTELDSYSTGMATVVLDNRSRVFEPELTTSPLYGLIEPYGQLKIVTSGYIQFVGIIDNWSYSYSEKGRDAIAQINATDNMAVLAKNTLADQTFAKQTSGNRIKSVLYGTDAYYNQPSCIDAGRRVITDDTVAEGANLLDYVQKVAANDGGLFFARRDGILAFKDGNFGSAAGLATIRKNLVCNSNFNIAPAGFWTGGVRFTAWAYQGTHSYGNSSSKFVDYSELSASKYLVDTPYYGSFYVRSPIAQTVLVYFGLTKTGVINPDGVNYQEYTFAANEVKRFDMGVIKSALPTDGITLGVTTSASAATGTIFIDCALVEQNVQIGTYFDGGSTITPPSGQTYVFSFEGTANNSTSLWTTTVNQIVDFVTVPLICDNNFGGIQFFDVSMTFASEKLYNRVVVKGINESTFDDLPSQAKYGLKELAFTDAILDTQDDNDSLTKFLLSLYNVPNYRAESIVIPLHSLSVPYQNTMLGMDLLSLIVLQFIPGNAGNTLIKNYQIIGINHNVTTEEHMIELRVSSLDNYGFVLDSPVLGFLDTNRLV
jgi:hypothetical protein